ncbi:MAG: hypothetical protein HYT88_05625 [Candidatus Omnitrophica bacterium]|nr:hypothetical protein [Candidatus Omnitrophota bacterium]MBI3009508.1 hypothetical protein [Candidatus Omnitrophota bacterium]
MDIENLWDKARKETQLLRLRLPDLSSFEATAVPYVFLAESSLNAGDTVVRKGHVLIERPAIMLPGFSPQFEGFAFDDELKMSEETITTFLLIRGVQFPSLKYRHALSSLDVYENSLQKAIEHFDQKMARAEDIQSGLVVGPEEAWQFSLLLMVGALVGRSADGDVRRLLEAWRKRQQQGS